jgi:two-component system response regulator FixJ
MRGAARRERFVVCNALKVDLMFRSRSHSASERRPLILVADDDLAVRESLQFALELEGWEIKVFGGGDDLISDPHLLEADCVVLDYRISPMDGLSIVSEVKALGLEAPVILVAAHATAALRRRATRGGIHGIVEKPLLDGTLVDSIRAALASSEKTSI